jgi:hypothetical protein
MGEARSPWRVLRPVLLAGAAAVSWLTLSSTAASADALSDTTSLLGGVTSSVSSVADKVATPAPAAQAPAPVSAPVPASTPKAGLLQPVVAPVAKLADNLVSSVPVVNHVVPAGTVSAVSAPLAQVADGATTAVVEVVVPPVSEAVPVLEPVLEPVADLVTGNSPLPVAIPELPGTAIGEELPQLTAGAPASDAITATASEPAEELIPAGSASTDAFGVPSVPATAVDVASLPGASVLPWTELAGAGKAAEQPGTDDHSPVPAQSPAVPGSGSGSGASSPGSSGSAAWLSPFSFDLPFNGLVLASEATEHAPSPVSFDPGSSPD